MFTRPHPPEKVRTMTDTATAMDLVPGQAPSNPSGRRSAGTGLVSGLVGGLCCLGSALAISTGLGALSFFQVWMDRYQAYFLLGSATVMVTTTVWMIRQGGFRRSRRVLIRHAVVMLGVYILTFGISTVAYGLVAH
jgi:hypothetical protein